MTNVNFLSERRAAAFLKISKTTLRRYRNAGLFQPIPKGNKLLYPVFELQEFQDKYKVRRGHSLALR